MSGGGVIDLPEGLGRVGFRVVGLGRRASASHKASGAGTGNSPRSSVRSSGRCWRDASTKRLRVIRHSDARGPRGPALAEIRRPRSMLRRGRPADSIRKMSLVRSGNNQDGGQALLNRRLLFALTGAAALALAAGAPGGASAQEKIKIGFLPGVTDPFYQVMQIGVEKAAADLGARGRHPDPADLGRRGADPDPRRADRARRSRLHHHRPGGEGPDGRPAAGRRRRRDQDHHRRHLPRRRRLRGRPGDISDQLHRVGQRGGRADLGARPRRGDRWQGHGLYQLHQPERQLGPGPRAGLRRGDEE